MPIASMTTPGSFDIAGIDPAGAIAKGNEARLKQFQVQETEQEMADKQAIKELSQIPGVDFSTPEGMGKFIGHLNGRVQPNTILKMVEMKNKMEAAEASRIERIAKMGDDERQRYADTQEMVMSAFDGLDKETDTDKRTQTLNERLDKFASERLSTGQPMYVPKAIETIRNMPWEQQQQLYRGSKHAKELIARAKDEATIARTTAATEALREGKAENWVSGDGTPLLRHTNGKVFKVDTDTGELTQLAAMPAGAYKAGSKNPAAVKEGDAVSLSEDENTWIAEYQQATGKQIPGIPAGSGAAARKARIEYMKAFVKLGKDRGYTGDEAGMVALQRDSAKEAMKRLTTSNAIIISGEKDLENVAKVIKEELTKLGGPDSPLVRKYWNKASTEWMGDPQFSGLNAAMANYQETAARVFSGQYGAGGTPVTYLHLAEQAIGKNPTLEQFTKLDETMSKLFKAREDSTRSALQTLRSQMELPAKPGSAATATPTPSNVPKNEASGPEGRADSIRILEDEVKNREKALEEARKGTDPRAIARAEEDLAAVRRELIRAKGSKPEAGKAGTTPKEGDTNTSKSGRPMKYVGGKWVYTDGK